MLNRRALMASATALPLTSMIPAAWAATPKDTVVFADQIDGLITFDPGEAYELVAQIIASSIYDRLVRYEAEDMTKLVGGVAESWTVSPDAKTYTFKLRPNQTVTVEEMLKFLGPLISKIEMPAQIEFRDELPKTLIGKLSKKELKAEAEAQRRKTPSS